MEDSPIVRIRVRGPHGSLYRAGRFTPYFAETLLADLRHRPRGRVEVVVRGDPATLTTLRDCLSALDAPAVSIVYRETRPSSSAA